MSTHSRIGKVKFKKGGATVTVLKNESNAAYINVRNAKVIVRTYDNEPITNADLVWYLEAAKGELLYGKE